MPRMFSRSKRYSRTYKRRAGLYRRAKLYKRFSRRETRSSGGAPRVSLISRAMNDVMVANMGTAGGGFTTYNTNGNVQVFNDITLGMTVASFGATQRFPMSMVYSADQLSAWPEISRLYAQYRIKGVKVTIIPMYNNATSSTLSSLGECVFAHDYIDNTTPTDENELLQMQGVQTRRLDKSFSYWIRPVARTTSYDAQGGATVNTVALNNPWIDTTAGGDAAHFGTKFYFNNINNTGTGTSNVCFKIRRIVYLEVKDTS